MGIIAFTSQEKCIMSNISVEKLAIKVLQYLLQLQLCVGLVDIFVKIVQTSV